MSIWQREDIRRRLPEYKVREGDVVYNAPYRATQTDLNVFVLNANPKLLQEIIEDQLNACVATSPALLGSQRGLHFESSEPWVVFIYAALRSLTSVAETDQPNGFLSALELSIWVPIVKHQEVAETATAEPAWFLPLVYTAPTASVVTGREVYGYPKVPAFLEAPDWGGPPVAVHLRESFSPAKGRRSASRHTADRLFSVSHARTSGGAAIRDSAVTRHPLLGAVLARFLANVPLIFRKQVGEVQESNGIDTKARPRLAAYTALVETRVPITRLRSLEAIDPNVDLHGKPNAPDREVTKRLGITNSRPEISVAIRGCTIDIQLGREIWVAAGRANYIDPLDAPGNGLIRHTLEPQPTSRRSAKASTGRSVLESDPLSKLDVVGGTGEAYFARTKPNAIAALLERHFPKHLPDPPPEPDQNRDFIVMMFVAATHRAAVKLYEFGVWVPVRHNGESAWYVPYMFRSPGAAVVLARERFGHPCQEGYITFVDKRPRPARRVAIRSPVSRGSHWLEWLRQDSIVFDPCRRPPSYPDFDADTDRRELHADGEAQHLVSLLQVRHISDTSRACAQRVVRSLRTVEAEIAHPPWFCKVTLPGHLRLGRLLELDGDKRVVRGYRLDKLKLVSTPSAWNWK
jgi:hypothetical protein